TAAISSSTTRGSRHGRRPAWDGRRVSGSGSSRATGTAAASPRCFIISIAAARARCGAAAVGGGEESFWDASGNFASLWLRESSNFLYSPKLHLQSLAPLRGASSLSRGNERIDARPETCAGRPPRPVSLLSACYVLLFYPRSRFSVGFPNCYGHAPVFSLF